ncbi:MAG: hypothetical protein PHN75_13400, partial [Syntrophales bacterium]|nr:hypothetical protein [Syntrophales bacterium]
YYLIGFRSGRFFRTVFEDIVWSTGGVFKKTMDIFVQMDYSITTLSKRQDIDTVEDLCDLRKRGHAFLQQK